MYEYNSEKILQRQKICLKCNSFVTHERIDEQHFACPLCSNKLPLVPQLAGKISIDSTKKYVTEFYRRMIEKYGDRADPNNQDEESEDQY